MSTVNDETPPPDAAPAPRFSFVRELGRGVLGEVHEVIDEVRAEPVVLKVFLRCRPRDPGRFKLEFEALARLEHPSLVKFHHLVDPLSDTNVALEEKLGTSGFAFTQEYVYGTDVLSWLQQPASADDLATLETRRTPSTGEIPVEVVTLAEESEAPSVETGPAEVSTGELGLGEDSASSIVEEMAQRQKNRAPLDLVLLRLERVVPQIVAGLQHLHRYGKVHGFLRPSNILVTREGVCKLTDYGIVPSLVYQPRGREDAAGVSLLQAPEQLPYVAPEVTDEATVAGDLYALGCVLFEAIAGFPPAEALEMTGTRAKKLEVPPLAELVPECPANWADRIDALLRPDPSERPTLGTVAEVVGRTEGRVVHLPRTVVPEPELFVGQENTISKIRDEARAVTDATRMHLVLVEGPSGTGKSTIVDEIAHWLSRRGWLVISGRCYNRESVPYQGWHRIASKIAEMCEALQPAVQELIEEDRRRAGVLFPQLAPPGEPLDSRHVGRLSAIRALRHILAVLAQQRPILLAIEDLHWASWDTASLLMDLFADESAISCLVLGTWRTDSERSGDNFLLRDLELSLLDVKRISVGGFTTHEAREFLVTRAPGASLEDLQAIIRTGRSSPRLLEELIWELENASLAPTGDDRRDQVLPSLYRRRMTSLEKPHEAMLNVLAVASGPLENGWLTRAVTAELGGSVLPAELTPEAIDEAFEEMAARRLVRKNAGGAGRVEWVISHDVCREVVLESLSDRDRARLAGRIADAVGEDEPDRHDLRFEYELRAGRVANAIKSAVRAARAAERRFAYHRAAKLWRWVLENAEKLDDPTVRPAVELARVEHLAGQHAEAAKLYREAADDTTDRVQRAQSRRQEAMAWLQAGDADSAVEALEKGFADFGETYVGRWHSPVSEAPRRWFAAAARWNQRLVEIVRPDAAQRPEQVRGELYDFALRWNDLLWSDRGSEVEARLARLASGTQDAQLLGLHRLRLATIHGGAGEPSRRRRALEWLEEAERTFVKIDDPACDAELHLVRAVLETRFGEFGAAYHSFEALEELASHRDAAVQLDRRKGLYWRAILDLYAGRLDDAERSARQLLHTYRGDRTAATAAYRVLARLALLRGSTQRAEAFVDEGQRAIKSTRPNYAAMLWLREQTRLHIALGRPEVAVGQLDVALDNVRDAGLDDARAFEVPLRLAMGQATCALAERHRILGQERPDETRARLRKIRRRLEEHVEDLNSMRKAETLRLFARIAMLEGRPKRALRWADAAIEALGAVPAPLHIAACTEARATVLARLERPEARGIIEQAWELYRTCGASFPLVLEGWPVPREAAMLKED